MIFDAYKRHHQSIREFSLLIDFPQIRLPRMGWGVSENEKGKRELAKFRLE